MSWETWARSSAAALGLTVSEEEMTLREALERLTQLETAISEQRTRLIEAGEWRRLTYEEVAAFETARKNVLGATVVVRNEMIRLEVPDEQIPDVVELAELPIFLRRDLVHLGATEIVFRDITPVEGGSTAFGAIRAGARPSFRRAEMAGTLGWVQAAVAIFAVTAIGALAAYFIDRLVNPATRQVEAVAEANIEWLRTVRAQADEHAEQVRACAAQGTCDVAAIPPPVYAPPPRIPINPTASEGFNFGKLALGVVGLGGVGWLIWKLAKTAK